MLPKLIFVLSMFVNAILAMPFNESQQDLEDVRSIVKYFIDVSAMPNSSKDATLYERAEEVHKCRKSLGITTRIGGHIASRSQNSPRDYTNKKNTETEKEIPIWDISPSDFDKFFDQARFDRYLTSINNPSFERRITWLYPDNGMVENIETVLHNL